MEDLDFNCIQLDFVFGLFIYFIFTKVHLYPLEILSKFHSYPLLCSDESSPSSNMSLLFLFL